MMQIVHLIYWRTSQNTEGLFSDLKLSREDLELAPSNEFDKSLIGQLSLQITTTQR